ncbi:hypothetical protein SLV14_004502 [Streptomyces sp. Je 1-4]|uniref:hypothetical protein n=1 Tax=Streptomyces TaxID=1883 RepID=UPI0021D848D7|nr:MULTISPECIES: hypothetical protein [unclassified Streptomyces]UYB41712.1 hypothetical protein SLV14_004502 [Streptomyces sp. Je 1-4]UZQ37971.1 hypothetical protein SLV14N_004502 [Streptomyces sp. Je 1-4] [Streptomyces sp. Je 1-4 4N24]UZQ45388.1 hypothetical protein SLV14NA_004502 [Streptomyces sp. Je 1-4] [Streptomyces sp. Je 1-4 4N24_ara]
MTEVLRRLLAMVSVLGVIGVPFGIGWLWTHPQSRPSRWIRHNAVDPITTRYAAWIDRRTQRRLGNACRNLPPTFPPVPWHEWRYVAMPVRQWCARSPWAAIAHAFKLAILAVAVLNVGTLVNIARYVWHNPPGSRGPRHLTGDQLVDNMMADPANHHSVKGGQNPLDPLGSLVRAGQHAVEWLVHKVEPGVSAVMNPLADPVATATTAAALVLLAMFFVAMRPAATVFVWLSDTKKAGSQQENRPRSILAERPGMFSRARVGETAQWRPVVVLLGVCGSLGQAYKQWDTGGPLVAPRVSLAAAERAVWSAWRTRHDRIRHSRQQGLKEHAALVVGALRAVEARQDTEADTGQVFEDTARMLLKIAQRYGEGRTLALLDPEDLNGVTPAVNREWLRLTILGSVVVGTAVGANLLDVPDSATGPLIGIISLVAVGVLYGARLVATDLIDVMRGQSRK